MKTNKTLIRPLEFAVIVANILFFFWILFNGIKENFQGNSVEKVSYMALMSLLILNVLLLIRKRKNDEFK